MSSSAKEKILKALSNTAEIKPIEEMTSLDSVFVQPDGDLVDVFKTQLDNIAGNCFVVNDESELNKELSSLITDSNWNSYYCNEPSLKSIFESNEGLQTIEQVSVPDNVDICITLCEALVARTGSVLVSSVVDNRKAFAAPEIHIVVAFESQLVQDVNIALRNLKKKYIEKIPSQVTIITGPSRTADIEKTLILGAHGPKKLAVFLIRK